MGFARYVGGIMLGVLAVLLAVAGVLVMLGLLPIIPASFDIPLGIVMLVIALFLFLYGWYSYKSAKPKGTINVHNV